MQSFADVSLAYEIIPNEEPCPYPYYGIRISKTVRSVLVEEKYISDITCCREAITELLAVLERNKVTPVSFHDVVEDWLVARYS